MTLCAFFVAVLSCNTLKEDVIYMIAEYLNE